MNDRREPLVGEGPRLISKEPPAIRAGFIRKVYSILTAQLLLTVALASPFVLSDALRAWVLVKGRPLVLLVSVLNILFMCLLMCPCGCQRNMRTFPTNYLLLGGFTVTEALLIGVVCVQYKVASVFVAVLLTGALVGALTAYAFVTKTDFSTSGVYLFAGAVGLLFCGILLMFFPQFPLLHKIYCCLGILLFSFYLIYDTQMIVGKGKCSLEIDDYVFGALQLYIDIIQLFLYIIQQFGDRND